MKRLVFALAFLALPLGAAAGAPLSPLGPEIRVNATTRGAQTTPAVASTPAGSSVVVWLGPDPGGSGSLRVFGQRFDPTGNRRGGEIQISSGGDARGPAGRHDPGRRIRGGLDRPGGAGPVLRTGRPPEGGRDPGRLPDPAGPTRA